VKPLTSASLIVLQGPTERSVALRNKLRFLDEYLLWLHYTSGVYYASYCADHVQLFCGHEPYVWLTQAHHVIAARVAGVEPFRQFTGIEHSLTCISVKYRDQPVTSVIVEFLGAE
jgi:hypothetical protein